jgi:membrane protein YdbS with pleckstrin-like domain
MDQKMAHIWKTMGDEFGPDPSLLMIHFLELLLFTLIGVMSWFFPLMIYAPLNDVIVIAGMLVPILLTVAVYISLSYRNTTYELTAAEIIWKRGILFKRVAIVPYTKVTNVDISQGPLARYFGIADLNIQTAGYHNPNGALSEMKISGVKQHEQVREAVMGQVRSGQLNASRPGSVVDTERTMNGKKTDDAATRASVGPNEVNERILAELVRIRELLEKRG